MAQPISPIAPRVPFLDQPTNMVSREWYTFFNQTRTTGNGIAAAAILTISDQTSTFPNSQILTPVEDELTAASAGNEFRLGLADTTVTPGDYGDEKHTVKITIDAKGRATAAQSYVLNSDNVTEGVTNLFFTVARARASLGGGVGISYTTSTGVIALANTAVTPGTYGDASHSFRGTVDQQGRLTAASSVAITIAAVAGATPIADGTHACGTGFITTVNGIITAITP